MKYNSLFESLSKKVGSSISVRRYNIADMISESYKSIYNCEEGTNLKKLAEAHLDDVRNNPTEIDRLSRNLCILKELSKLSESGEIDDKDLKVATSSKIEGEVKESKDDEEVEEKDDEDLLDESAHDEDVSEEDDEDLLDESKDDEDVEEADDENLIDESADDEDVEEKEDEDLLEDAELSDEEVEELTKHLKELRKAKKVAECDKKMKESMKGRKLKKLKEYRDFEWEDDLWAVVKDNGDYAGIPCRSWDEAYQLSAGHEDSHIYKLVLDMDESKKVTESTTPRKLKKANESKSYEKMDLSEFAKKSSSKAFVKTFKKLDSKLHEGTALTRQEAISLYKAANSAMTHLSVELEHNPEFLATFKESVSILSKDVSKLLASLSEGKGPSKATMKSLAKFSESILLEDDEVEDEFIEDEEGELVSEEEEEFDQEYADARKELHDELADEYEESEDPGVQEKLAKDAEEVAELTGEGVEEESEEVPEETDESAHDEDVEEVEESEEEEETPEEDSFKFEDDSEITDDELAELKKHLKEMRAAKKAK